MAEPVLEVRGLQKHFPVRRGVLLSRVVGWVKAVDGVSFTVGRGETFALVGESGCGKTTTARVILLLERPTAGMVLMKGQEIERLRGRELRRYRASVQAVFQDPMSSLNPRKRVRSIVGEPLIVNRALPRRAVAARVAELLEQVGLPSRSAELFPHEFSGGQRQRIAIARALALNPSLVVLDEPVSALDVSIRAQIMNLLKDLQAELGLTYFLIAHDLATVRYIATTVGVMYLGRLVEVAPAEELFTRPRHPYTQALLSAALPSHPDVKREEVILPGEVPSPLHVPAGCRFHPRCPAVLPICSEHDPSEREVGAGHRVACHLY
ncbi:MAG TPA: oligopeptide/dipeptide ABC transporter ATP-binding protein [Methylomirabilota bacterium]|jgi:oligopeptide/dipeptide ABC transporter ATP-binding protein|nr:oligopeptide/dipeptide ABC transporter ATP-binding protein [Methylomirabilota bacterium]